MFPGSGPTGIHHVLSVECSEGRDVIYGINLAHRLVSADLRMILDIALNILPPNDWVIIVRREQLRDMFGPRLNGMKPFLAE